MEDVVKERVDNILRYLGSNVKDFYFEFMMFRKRWRLKRIGIFIMGDLIYRLG